MPSFTGARELAGLFGLGGNLATGAGLFAGPQLFMQGQSGSLLDRSVQNLPGIIPDQRNDLGRKTGNAISNELQYITNQLGQGSMPYGGGLGINMPRGKGKGGQGRGLRFNRGQSSPDVAAPGSAQETGMYGRYIPGSAQDRAYMQEASRVAQLTAQDPELKRYADKRQLAVAPGATPAQIQSAEDIGMAIWAQKYGQPGGLARAVKPGQAGYDVIQQTLIGQDAGNAARQGMGYQAQSQMIPTPPPGLGGPQGLPSVNMQPTYGAGGLEVDPERLKKFQALINQAKE